MLSLNNKPLITVVIFAIISLGMIFSVIMPLIFDIKNIGLEIGGQKAKIDNYDLRISKAREFISFAKEHKDDFNKLDGVFVDTQMPLSFINSLEAAARVTNVKIEFLPSMLQQTMKNDWPSIAMEADISGSIPNILHFIEKIENIPYLVAIQSVSIQTKRQESLQPPVETAAENVPDAGEAHILLKAYAKIPPK